MPEGPRRLNRGTAPTVRTAIRKEQRLNSYRRGYGTRRWKEYRKRYQISNPWCAECLKSGKEVPMRDIDHIIPVSGPFDPLFWDQTNHQPLCHSCHSRKTASEDGGFGHRRHRKGQEQ